MKVEVLGTGCANCRNTVALIEQIAAAQGKTIELRKVEDLREIMSYRVMATPGVVIDGKIVHAGGVPSREKVLQWFSGADRIGLGDDAGGCCCGH